MSEKLYRKPYMTFQQAHNFKEDLLKKWTPQIDVWPYKYGDPALGYLSIFGSTLITYMYRKELKLRPFARLTCYMPVVGLAGISTFIFQDLYISTRIIMSDACPICISTKASVAQVTLGVVYPMVMGAAVCLNVADRLLTYPVPPLTKAPKEVFQLFKKIVLKNPRPYLVLSALNILAASFVSYSKQNALWELESKLRNPI